MLDAIDYLHRMKYDVMYGYALRIYLAAAHVSIR